MVQTHEYARMERTPGATNGEEGEDDQNERHRE